jgi:glutamate carboxypeptidase
MLDRLHELVSCESPSGFPDALESCSELLAGWGDAALGRPARRLSLDGTPHLLWAAPDPAVLVLGHFDTVWPLGTLKDWPFTVVDGVASGPGVFDMKAGIVQLLTALELVADRSRISVLLTSDEEVGSTTSRALIEEQARLARAVLVCEPSADGGAVKIARKGIANYEVTVRGRAAHAGLEPERGVNAAIELARHVLALGELAAPDNGTSVTPTVMMAGTTTNTVPESARLHVDARGWTRTELDRVDQAMRSLTPWLPGAALTVNGGINRYPLESTVATELLAAVQAAAGDVGLAPPDGVRSGGASDGNFSAVPSL